MATTTFNRKAFFDLVRGPVFKGTMSTDQVSGCEAILAEAERRQMSDTRPLAYILATPFWETAQRMQPVIETRQAGELGNPSVDVAIARLERSWAAGKMPWVKTPYWRKDTAGKSWLGRGLVQLTWPENYEKMGKICLADLVGNPDLALRLDVAVMILFEGMLRGSFTGKKLGDCFTTTKTDWIGARAIINGTDHNTTIAGIAQQFDAALRTALIVSAAPSVALPSAKPPAPAVPTISKPTLMDRLKQFIGITH